ncbi:MAG TPA: RecQ family zinc-binding domain-containing protein, partial [Prolixibacteraceae bacterium]|nr:RecQ family zinc-binding domain-containing protein [Prolixibacteraceae bacterium]
AGRAGRDGKKAMAVLLYNNTDTVRLKKGIAEKFPEPELIRRVYEALGNYFQIAVGFGRDTTHDFHLADFAKTFHFSIVQVHHSLKILEQDGYLEASDELERPSMVHFRVNRDDLYKFQVANASFDAFVKLLLRSYTGMFSEYAAIDEALMAKRSGTDRETIYQFLCHLDKQKIIHYIPQKDCPFVVYTKERIESSRFRVSKENYSLRKKRYEEQVQAVIDYASSGSVCRSIRLLQYFGEPDSTRCGACDVCDKLNHLGMSNLEFDRICADIQQKLKKEALLRHELFFRLTGKEENIQSVLRWLLDNGMLAERIDKKLEWKG